MSDHKLPPAPGLPPERSRTVAPSVGGNPPPQPRNPTPPPPKGDHPVAQSDADVSHGPAVHGKTDGRPDPVVPEDSAIPDRTPRTDDKGPGFAAVGVPGRKAPKEEGNMVRFDWYPNSVGQVVSLNLGQKRVEAIMGRVITAGTDPGPTSLTFRKVKCGDAMTTGKALHTGSINLVGNVLSDPADVDQIMAMTPEVADRELDNGDCIVADFQGNMASARGTVMIKVVER